MSGWLIKKGLEPLKRCARVGERDYAFALVWGVWVGEYRVSGSLYCMPTLPLQSICRLYTNILLHVFGKTTVFTCSPFSIAAFRNHACLFFLAPMHTALLLNHLQPIPASTSYRCISRQNYIRLGLNSQKTFPQTYSTHDFEHNFVIRVHSFTSNDCRNNIH